MTNWQAGAFMLALAALAGTARGQSTGSFLIVVRDGAAARQVPSGSLVTLKGKIGARTTVQVELTYAGTARGDLGSATLTGSEDFELLQPAPAPVVLGPGDTAVFQVRLRPSSGVQTLAQLGITARELPQGNQQPGPYGLILLGLSGTAPEIRFAYASGADGNVTPVAGGGVIRITKAPVNAQTVAAVLIVNRGSAPADVTEVSLEGGEGLDLVQLPFLPLTLGAGQSVQFGVRYSPKALVTTEGTLRITADGNAVALRVEAIAQGPKWVYTVQDAPGAGEPQVAEAGGEIALGEVEIGWKKTVWVRVRNEGNDTGVVAGVAVSGQGFGLVDPPLPQTPVKVGAELWFGVSCTADQAGRNTGRLRVGDDTFVLSVMVNGEMLEYSYTAGNRTKVDIGGIIMLPAAAVGQSVATLFSVENRGNRAASIQTIALSGGGHSYALASLPQVPAVLEPGGKISFQIRFTPAGPGLNTDVLTVGQAFFNLNGQAAALPELPGYRWEGAGGSVAPMTQPAVGLTLLETYPVTLKGTLTMTVEAASFGSDPAVQFSTGGRVASFTIPAGTTRAVFANGSATIRLQTGTAAGTIIVKPGFFTESGVDRTPSNPDLLSLNVPSAAPVLLGARMEVTAAGLNFIITGYSTPRSLTALEVTVKRKSGKSEVFRFDVASSAALWFQSAPSLEYGGLFTATAPFTILGSADDRNKLIEELDTITVTAENERGVSQPVTAPAG